MRVCLIAPIPPFRGGVSKYAYSLAKELEKRHELLLLSYKRQYPKLLFGKKSQTDPVINQEHIINEFKHLSFDIDSASIVSWSKTSKKIAVFSPDIVVLPWFVVYWTPMYLYFIRSLKKQGIKVVIICINVFEHEDNFIKRFLAKLVLRSVDSLIVHSDQEKDEILKFHPKATVIKHLLPLFEYCPHVTTRSDHKLNLLFFGCVRPYKGLDTLLNAIGILNDRDVALKIAGDFWYDKNSYLKLIKDLDIAAKVEIIDQYIPNNELSFYFSWADLVVLPYKKTKTSGIIATAYAFGKPVLATNVGGFYEVVEDEYTGKIVTADDPKAFADGIVWFINHRKTNFAGNIQKFTSNKMSWDSLVRLLEEFASA